MCTKEITTFLSVAFSILCLISADCNVVSKSEWGGLDPVRVKYLARPVDLVISLHSVTPRCTTDAMCAKFMKNIQTYLMDEWSFWDVGSSFYVGGNGKIYEGVGWLHVGAHTIGYNSRSIGISFIGNYNLDNQPSEEQLNATRALLKCGVDNGHLTANYHFVGQSQLTASESYGKRLYNYVRLWLEDYASLKPKT